MKPFLFITSLLFTITASAITDGNLNTVQEQSIMYKGSSYPALVVSVEATSDFLKSTWKDYVKDNHDVRLKGYGFLTNKDVLSAQGEPFTDLTEKRADLYTRFSSKDDGIVQIELFMTLGYDVKIGPENYSEIYQSLKNSLVTYLNEAIPTFIKEEIKFLSNEFSELSKNLKGASKDERKLNKDIEKAQEEIKDNIEENEELRASSEEMMKEKEELEQKQRELQSQIKSIESKLNKRKKELNGVDIN